jgi:two-component SAPR family response regulator
MPFRYITTILIVLLFCSSPGYSQSGIGAEFTGLKFCGNYKIEAGDSGIVKIYHRGLKTKFEAGGTTGINLGDIYSLSFKFCVYLNKHFASIFEIENGNYSIRLRYLYHPDSSKVHLQLRINGRHNIISFARPLNEFVDGNWFDVKLDVNEVNQKIALTLNGSRKQAVNKYINTETPSIIRFGQMLPDGDCLAMIVKDLRIYKDGIPKHFYKFNETGGNIAFDSEGKLDVEVVAPDWVLESHYKWRTDKLPTVSGLKNVMPFYRLVTNSRMVVLEEKGTGRIIGDLLPVKGDSIDFVAAWLDTNTSKLYTSVAVTNKDRCVMHLFSIVLPVVSEKTFAKLGAVPPSIFSRTPGTFFVYSALFLLAVAIPSTAFFMIRKKRNPKRQNDENQINSENRGESIEPRKNLISIFGGLRLIDPDGLDIHGELSGRLQELLAALLFYSASDDDGKVPLRKLEKIIWSDIPKEKLKNNRNVAFSKLRKLVSKMNGITFESDSENVIVKISPEITNEAVEFIRLRKLLSIKAKISADLLVDNFINIIKGGILLQGINSDWIEKERFEIANDIIEILLRRCEYLYLEEQYERCNETAGLINIYDPANEAAFRYKLKSLFYLGRHSLVEETYNSYCQEYQSVYGQTYPHHVRVLLKD